MIDLINFVMVYWIKGAIALFSVCLSLYVILVAITASYFTLKSLIITNK